MKRMKRWIAAGFFRLPQRGVRSLLAVLALLAVSSGGPRSAHALGKTTDQITISIGVKDTFPPASVTDLAAAGSSTQEGQLLLMWTAPDEDNLPMPAVTAAQSYQIRYATFSVTDLGGNTTTWFNMSSTAPNAPSPQLHSQADSLLVTGLEQGVTYYFGLKSADEAGNISLIDRLAELGPQSNALVRDAVPPVVTGLSVNVGSDSINLSWSPSTAPDIASYRIYWDTTAPADVFLATRTLSAPATFFNFTGLTAANSYFFYVTAIDRGVKIEKPEVNPQVESYL
jgi:hypothetical protein